MELTSWKFPFYSRGIKLWSNKKNQVDCLHLILSKKKNVEPDHQAYEFKCLGQWHKNSREQWIITRF